MGQIQSLDKISLRMYQLRKLKELHLSSGVFNTEGLMLILNKKYKTSKGERILFKYLDLQEISSVMDRKEKILSYLNQSPYKQLDDLIIPEYEVFVDGELAGFAMPLIEHHKNMGALLDSHIVPFEEKKTILVQLGELIDRVDRVKDSHKMYFGDLNEYNFILDHENQLKAIDLDSCYVTDLEGVTPPSMTYYLLKNNSLWNYQGKYKRSMLGVVIPNKDSDLYSYQMIILSTLSKHPIFREDVDTYYRYLEYLKSIGVEEDLLDMFGNIYSQKSNENPKQLIKTLDHKLAHKATFEQFQNKTSH